MKSNNTSCRKRQTKKRGGTPGKNEKTQKTQKTQKTPKTQKRQSSQQKQDRIIVITNRIRQYNYANPEKMIAEKYGVRALTSKNNNEYTNKQLTDPNDSNYLNDTELYNLYEEHKKVTAEHRKQLRYSTAGKQNLCKNPLNNEVDKERLSPVKSLIKPFIDPDGNQSAYPFSDKKYVPTREIGILSSVMSNSPKTSPLDLFNDLNIPKTPPKTPIIDYRDDDDFSDMFDNTPNK